MNKYLSCPLCGTPEPEEIMHGNDNGTEIWVFRCLNTTCMKILKVEDITEEYSDFLDLEEIGEEVSEFIPKDEGEDK